MPLSFRLKCEIRPLLGKVQASRWFIVEKWRDGIESKTDMVRFFDHEICFDEARIQKQNLSSLQKGKGTAQDMRIIPWFIENYTAKNLVRDSAQSPFVKSFTWKTWHIREIQSWNFWIVYFSKIWYDYLEVSVQYPVISRRFIAEKSVLSTQKGTDFSLRSKWQMGLLNRYIWKRIHPWQT